MQSVFTFCVGIQSVSSSVFKIVVICLAVSTSAWPAVHYCCPEYFTKSKWLLSLCLSLALSLLGRMFTDSFSCVSHPRLVLFPESLIYFWCYHKDLQKLCHCASHKISFTVQNLFICITLIGIYLCHSVFLHRQRREPGRCSPNDLFEIAECHRQAGLHLHLPEFSRLVWQSVWLLPARPPLQGQQRRGADTSQKPLHQRGVRRMPGQCRHMPGKVTSKSDTRSSWFNADGMTGITCFPQGEREKEGDLIRWH